MAKASSLIQNKLFLEKTPLNLGFQWKLLEISIVLKEWSRTKNFYLYALFLFFELLFLLYLLLLKKLLVTLMKRLIGPTKQEEIQILVFFLCFIVSVIPSTNIFESCNGFMNLMTSSYLYLKQISK